MKGVGKGAGKATTRGKRIQEDIEKIPPHPASKTIKISISIVFIYQK